MLAMPKDGGNSTKVVRELKKKREERYKRKCRIIVVSVEEAFASSSATKTGNSVGAADFTFKFVIVR